MTERIIMAGFGGQGILFMGRVLCEAGLLEAKEVSWLPSYGPEMRGGTAHCAVVLSSAPIASPVVTQPSALIVMNGPSLDRFEGQVAPGGILVVNRGMVERAVSREDVRVVEVDANAIAAELGAGEVANVVALGALVQATEAVSMHSVEQALRQAIPEQRKHLLEVNLRALHRGSEEAAGRLAAGQVG